MVVIGIEVWLKMKVRAKLIEPSKKLPSLLQETDELISIFFQPLADTLRQDTLQIRFLSDIMS